MILTKKQLNFIISLPKDNCLVKSKEICFLLNALYQIYMRSCLSNQESKRWNLIKHDVSNILLLANMGYEKIAKQCIVEGDVRKVQSILDLIRTVLRNNEPSLHPSSLEQSPSLYWLLECESRLLMQQNTSFCLTADS